MTMEARITRHVNRLFEQAQDTQANRELKEEIQSNLTARIEDYVEQGMNEDQAFQNAIQHVAGLDDIFTGNHRVQRVPYWTAVLQSALIYSLIAWIITIPMRVLVEGNVLNNLLMILSLFVGGTYVFYMLKNKNNHQDREDTTVIRTPLLLQWARGLWWIWAGFILVLWGTQAAVRFGSNLWYSRPIHVEGPYQFAVIAIAFAIPLLSIIIPLVVHRAYRIVSKYEVGDVV